MWNIHTKLYTHFFVQRKRAKKTTPLNDTLKEVYYPYLQQTDGQAVISLQAGQLTADLSDFLCSVPSQGRIITSIS